MNFHTSATYSNMHSHDDNMHSPNNNTHGCSSDTHGPDGSTHGCNSDMHGGRQHTADDTWQITCIAVTATCTAIAATHTAAGDTHYGGQQMKNGSRFTTRTRARDNTDMSVGLILPSHPCCTCAYT